MTPNAEQRTYTVREAASELHVSPQSVYRLVHSGELPHVRIRGAIRIAAGEVAILLASRSTRAWTRVDRRGRSPGTPRSDNSVRGRRSRLTLPFRWEVLAGRVLLDVGEAADSRRALRDLEIRMRQLTEGRTVRGRWTAVESSGYRTTVELPLSYFRAQRFLASPAGERMRIAVEERLRIMHERPIHQQAE